LQGYAGVQFRV